MGRTRKVLSVIKKHFTKKEKEERERIEQGYKVKQDEVEAQEELSEEGKAEFERIKRNAFWLDNLDRNELNIYCYYWTRVKKLMKELEEETEEEKGKEKISAKYKVMLGYHKQMMSIEMKLGLTTVDRMRIMAPEKERKENKFLKYLE